MMVRSLLFYSLVVVAVAAVAHTPAPSFLRRRAATVAVAIDECIPAVLEIWKCSDAKLGWQIVDFTLEFANYTGGNMISISESYAESIGNSTDWYRCMYNPSLFIIDVWYTSGSISGMSPTGYFTIASRILERLAEEDVIDWSRAGQMIEVDIAEYVADRRQMTDLTSPVGDQKYRSGRTFRVGR
jgi:hypothetical protein